MKRYTSILVVAIGLAFVLAACGGGKKGTAEDFLEAVSEGNVDDANDKLCDDLREENPSEVAEFDLQDVECEEEDDVVTCSFTADGNAQTWVFTFEDNKICGINTGLPEVPTLDETPSLSAPPAETPSQPDASSTPADGTTPDGSTPTGETSTPGS